MSELARLKRLWKKVETTTASVQEKIDAACLAGKLDDVPSIPAVYQLLDDEDENVRYFALESLVLSLGLKGRSAVSRCWSILADDPSDDLRALAASCIGSSYYGTGLPDVFNRLKCVAADESLSGRVRFSAYSALFQVAGCPPLQWPGVSALRFDSSEIDWERITQLEAEISARFPPARTSPG